MLGCDILHQKRRTYECYDIFYLKALDAMVKKLILKNLKKCSNSPCSAVGQLSFQTQIAFYLINLWTRGFFSLISGLNSITFNIYNLFIFQQWCLL